MCAPKMLTSCFKVMVFVEIIIIAAMLRSRLSNLSSSYEDCSVKMEKSGDGEIVIKTNALMPSPPASCSDDLITKFDGFGDHKLSVAWDPLRYLIETRTEDVLINTIDVLIDKMDAMVARIASIARSKGSIASIALSEGSSAWITRSRSTRALNGLTCTATTTTSPGSWSLWGRSESFSMTCSR